MAFDPTIPQPIDTPNQSQPALLANFQAMNTYLAVDHNAFNTTNAGKHKQVTYVISPGYADLQNGRIGLFNAVSPLTGNRELFKVNSFRSNLNTDKQFPMTAALFNTNGWAYLPSGLILKWGTFGGFGAGNIQFPQGAGFPAYNITMVAWLIIKNNSVGDPNLAVTATQLQPTGINYNITNRTSNNAAAATVMYMAIGI